MDNGGMRLTHVKIPRRNLLMRFVRVSETGEYKKIGNEKMLFGTMTYTRMMISKGCGLNLAKAVTTGVRYSAVRRQFQMQRVVLGGDIEELEDGGECEYELFGIGIAVIVRVCDQPHWRGLAVSSSYYQYHQNHIRHCYAVPGCRAPHAKGQNYP